MLNQRLGDMKKTLQHELKTNGSGNGTTALQSNGLVISGCQGTKLNGIECEQTMDNSSLKTPSVAMDDVNFRYLKHVILKFLTSREVKTVNFNIPIKRIHSIFSYFDLADRLKQGI